MQAVLVPLKNFINMLFFSCSILFEIKYAQKVSIAFDEVKIENNVFWMHYLGTIWSSDLIIELIYQA